MSELPNKAFFRPDEVADYYGVKPGTVYKWVYEGKMDGIRLGKKTIRISREAVLSFAKATNE